MQKELKISELASIWSTSVPTTWNRIRKEGLTTFKKKDETNKEVNFVTISEDILNKYVNNVNNLDNNVYYEDMLNVNNVNNSVENVKTKQEQAFNKDDIKDIINTIANVNNDYNDRLKTLTDELITYKSKQLLLEDKANKEGFYLNEINKLEKANNQSRIIINVLITFITILLLFITGYITYQVAKSDTVSNTVTDQVKAKTDQVSEQVSVQVEQPKAEPKPQPVKQPVQRKRR